MLLLNDTSMTPLWYLNASSTPPLRIREIVVDAVENVIEVRGLIKHNWVGGRLGQEGGWRWH